MGQAILAFALFHGEFYNYSSLLKELLGLIFYAIFYVTALCHKIQLSKQY